MEYAASNLYFLIMLSKLLILIGNSHSVMSLQAVDDGLLQNYVALAHPYMTVAMQVCWSSWRNAGLRPR